MQLFDPKPTAMKKLAILFLIVPLLTGCFSASVSVKQIGKVNMISMRNFDNSVKYEPLATYFGGSQSEIEKSQAKTIEEAIEQTVRKVPGGEFIMNAKIYAVGDSRFAVEGDVWGNPLYVGIRGFKVGDRVTWSKNGSGSGNFTTGTINALKDDKTCLIQVDSKANEIVEVNYDRLSKAVNLPAQDSGPVKKKSGCFIATACYGDYDAPEVKTLRIYRDSVLLKSPYGQSLVDMYYSLSPPLARMLDKSDWAKSFVRSIILEPIVSGIKKK